MRILGIETSCDETAVCLIETSGAGRDLAARLLGNGLVSQAALHAEFGGVYPNLAKREHAKNLVPMLEVALKEAGALVPVSQPSPGAALVSLKETLAREPELFQAIVPFLLKHERPQLDAIAVTAGPGLEPALWVGINFAKALSAVWQVPLVAVNHMEGHLVMPLLEQISDEWRMRSFEFPVLALLISGGHTELILSRDWLTYERLGETRDDAAGEAFDKVARLMNLPYPGGPEISRLAAAARRENVRPDFKFTRPMLHDGSFDFSFSGLKTAVRKLVDAHEPLTDDMKKKIALEFEETVADVLTEKTLRVAEAYGAATLVVGGGVSANERIKERLANRLVNDGHVAKMLVPPPALATDNAFMIALAGALHAAREEFIAPEALSASGNLRLEN